MYFSMWNKWLHTTQIEKQKVQETETIFWEISTERENTYTGNWKLLPLFFVLFFFCYVVFWIPTTRHNIHIEQKQNNSDKTVSLTFFCRPRSKRNIQSPCWTQHDDVFLFFFLDWASSGRVTHFYIILFFSVTTLPREAVTNCTLGLVSAKKQKEKTGKIKLAYVHKYTFSFLVWTPQPQSIKSLQVSPSCCSTHRLLRLFWQLCCSADTKKKRTLSPAPFQRTVFSEDEMDTKKQQRFRPSPLLV